MKIQIDGTNVKNKGAELMLYSVLEEIEKKYPSAQVVWNDDTQMGKSSDIETTLNFDKPLGQKIDLLLKPTKFTKILRRLGLPYKYFTRFHPIKGLDVMFDASGFHYSDQFKIREVYLKSKEKYYSELKKNGTKIVLLAQAFGPFETVEGKKMAQLLAKYADLIFARDEVSYGYFEKVGVPMDNILLYPDFTSLASYKVPEKHRNLEGYVCLIPNKRMVDKGAAGGEEYMKFLIDTIKVIQGSGNKLFLLNHEGKEDLSLCLELNKLFNGELPVVTDLTAREVKGIISISKMVISSRFHGVASALNTAVPCLATSWSHKYKMLFNDFGQSDCILDIKNPENNTSKILDFLTDKSNAAIRADLKENALKVKKKNMEMWDKVWEKAGK